MTTKETLRALLDRLPDDCSLDDVLYQLHVVQAVESGLAYGATGRIVPHEQFVVKMRRKWLPGSAR